MPAPPPDPTTGARSTPIFQTTAFVFDDVDHAASLFNLQTFGNIYARLSNPTTAVLEERIASLEGGRGTTCTASGHSAQMVALLPLMEPGDRIVAANRLYGGSITQFGKTFRKFDWHCSFVDMDDREAVREAAMQPGVKALFAESLANPGGVITDIAMLKEITAEVGIPLIIDNTMATPWLCQPFEHGADIIIHSTTKFLSGHGNAMGGAIVDSGRFDWFQNDRFPALSQPEPAYHGLTFFETFGDLAYTTYGHAVGLRDLGPTMAPMNAYLTIMGTETLALRMQTACRERSGGGRVPGRASGSCMGILCRAAGLAISCAGHNAICHGAPVRSSPSESRAVSMPACNAFSAASCSAIWRISAIPVRLILHPASTTHRQLTEEQRVTAGAGDDVIRLSIGLETVNDIIADLDQALG